MTHENKVLVKFAYQSYPDFNRGCDTAIYIGENPNRQNAKNYLQESVLNLPVYDKSDRPDVAPSNRQGATSTPARTVLPFQPRGLNRSQAAAYIGISPTTFDKLVSDGSMPRPVAIRSRKVWDRFRLDAAFESLAEMTAKENYNEWDDM